MTNQIATLPGASTFGLSFDYSVWSPGTTVTLANVLWDSNYRDIPYFATVNDAVNFIKDNAGPVIEVSGMTYAAQGAPVRLNVPFSEANRFNYIMVENEAMPIYDNNRMTRFFYFIHEVRYVAPNTTEIVVQLDVWTTYQYSVKFNRAYLERGHAAFILGHSDAHYGRDILTAPEGFDLGNDYVVSAGATWKFGDADNNNFYVVIVSTIRLDTAYGTVDDPSFKTADGSNAEGLPNGASIYVTTANGFKNLMDGLSDYPWIAQGIVSVTLVPTTVVDWNNLASSPVGAAFDNTVQLKVAGANGAFSEKAVSHVMRKDFREAMKSLIPSRYRNLSKFLTYPYMAVELTTFSGTPLVVKPETVQSDDFSVTQWSHIVPPSPRIMFTIDRLNATDSSKDISSESDDDEKFDVMTGITNLPSFSVVNNSYLNFMASNAHSIAYAFDSADWSQQKALTGAQLSANQATNAMNASTASADVGVSAASSQTALQNRTAATSWAVNGAARVLSGAATGGAMGAGSAIGGAVMGGMNTAIQNSARDQSTAISNNAALAQNAISVGAASYNRDTNLAYARYSAQGDYANTIAGINAKTQDARLISPTTSGQVGGDAFNIAVRDWRLSLRFKRINEGAMRRIGEFWLRYGYAVNVPIVMPKDFQCMTNFTYWKLSETYISSSTCPEQFKQTIRGIFEKGTTVWRDPSRIGMIDYADNFTVGSIQS